MATLSVGAVKFRRSFNRAKKPQSEIASLIGCSQGHVSRLLSGASLPYSAAEVEELRKFCGASLRDWSLPFRGIVPPLARAGARAA